MELSPIQIETSLLETVVETPLNETQWVLAKALELLGPNGERWLRGERASGVGCHCSVMSVAFALGAPFDYLTGRYHAATGYLSRAAGDMGYTKARHPAAHCNSNVTILNECATSFSEVRAMFLRAIELAASP